MFLHVADTINSTLGGWEGEESQTKWIVLALVSLLLTILTDLQFMRTHFHSVCYNFIRKLYLVCNNYFYDGTGNLLHVLNLYTMNSLV